ncbi:TAXI family TRAP transporter solute-binding subunit [Candidatus Deianiraea vastatrix]|uniref:Transporter substrate-binding protein n=1 Tax=Candidatus Deianiraea vastatrix TaxID=2163644 RepID=A0A5B8XF01_9RICK|nr:TAXI family TRAP transporter solute-binding subunit [Candidatus Deianiraea vastatrix]QED23556.1 Putative transporter substrate-binding protein [Candidatus Deianiraea vastatrix]
MKLALFLPILLFFASGCQMNRGKPFFSGEWGYFDKTKADSIIKVKNEPKKTKDEPKKIKNEAKKATKNNKKAKINEPKKTIIIAGSKPHSMKYNVAGSICMFLNKMHDLNIHCVVEPTSSVRYAMNHYNQYDFIISQTSLEKDFMNNKQLTSMFSLFPETFTILVSEKSGIKSIQDLKGKKIYVGKGENSAKIALSEILKHSNMSISDVNIISGVNMSHALCNSSIDAIATDINHPDGDVDEFVTECGVKILPIPEQDISKIVTEHDEYLASKINISAYPGYNKDIASFAIMTNLIATSRVDEKLAYKITKAVFDNMPKFKMYNKVFLDVEKDKMTEMKNGLMLPIHKGALKYYKENNIIKK